MPPVKGTVTPARAGPPLSVLEAIEGYAGRTPDAPAILGPHRSPLNYEELVAEIRATAGRLTDLGVRPRDRVAVITTSDMDGAVLLLSVITSAICCPVNPAWSKPEILAYFDALRPVCVIVPGDAGASVRMVIASSGIPVLAASRGASRGDGIHLNATEGSGRVAAEPCPVEAGPVVTGAPETGAPEPAEALVLRTSGTTAAGKIVPLTMSNILAAASASVRAYHLTAQDRRLNVMPLYHVQGIVGSLITSLLAGSSIVCVPVFQPESVLTALAEFQPTWMSATPAMHRALLDGAGDGFRPPHCLRFIRCGSGALPPGLRELLSERYGVPVVESYGMSEAHQIASTPLPPAPGATGMLPTGSEVAVVTGDGKIETTPQSSGEVVIRGPNVIERYLAPSTADAFQDGWLRTGDLGTLQADGSLTITGRIKELINCGGEKLSPYEIENVLLRHPAVCEAVAFPIPDPVLTERPGAAAVLAPGATSTAAELRSFASAHLAPYKVPRIVLCSAIPVGPSGKVVRGSLAEWLGGKLLEAAPPAAAIGRRPGTAVEAALAGLWALALGRDTVGADGDFLALGGDSLSGVSLLTMVRDIFAVELSPLTLFDEANTVTAMAAMIGARRAAPG